VLPCVILACSKDPVLRLQLCQLLLACAGSRPDGLAAMRALLPLLTERSCAAGCLAGGLRSLLAASTVAAAVGPSGGPPRADAQVRAGQCKMHGWWLPQFGEASRCILGDRVSHI
jgi:hypothetical protein